MSNQIIATSNDNAIFGAGYIYGVNAGNVSVPSVIIPGKFSTIQEASVDITKTVKDLMGNTEFPELQAAGSQKITGKLTTGRINIELINQLVFNDNFVQGTGGGQAIVNFEAHTVASSPTDTVTVTNGANFKQDLGVFNPATNNQLIPNEDYTVNTTTGVYTLSGAYAGVNLFFSYAYATTTGSSLTVTNQVMGLNTRPAFALYLYQGAGLDLILYLCRATKITIPEKREDFCILEIDFTATQNSAGNVFTWTSPV